MLADVTPWAGRRCRPPLLKDGKLRFRGVTFFRDHTGGDRPPGSIRPQPQTERCSPVPWDLGTAGCLERVPSPATANLDVDSLIVRWNWSSTHLSASMCVGHWVET